MKIIQVVQHLAPGGIETMVLELQRIYQKTDEVIIISLEGRHDSAIKRWPPLYGVKCQLIFFNKQPGVQLKLLLDLIKLFKQLKPDAVHTHHIGPLLYAGMAARMAGVRSIIHTEHDAWHLESSKRRRKLQAWALKRVNPLLVADAQHVAKTLQSFFPQQTTSVIVNGIDTHRFYPAAHISSRKSLGLPTQKILIGCAARLVKGKGHSYLIQALQVLPANIHLVLAGDGPLRYDLMAQARQLQLVNRVHFLGNLRNMPEFYRSLDLFCLPSEAEGLPLSPLEAQACGVPVLMTDTGGCKEALCHKTGLLVPIKDSQALASGVMKLLSRFSRSDITSPRDYILHNHDLSTVARKYRIMMKLNRPLCESR